MNLATTLSSRLIGTLFVERGLLSESQIRVALEIQRETGQQLGQILVERFGVSRRELASVVAEQWAEMGEPTDRAANESWRRLGEIFVERGFVTPEQLAQALERQRETGERVGEALVAQGSISKFELAGALAEQMSTLEEEDASPEERPVAKVVSLSPRLDEPAPPVEPSPEPPAAVGEAPPAAGTGGAETGASEEAEPDEPEVEEYGARLPEPVEPELVEPQLVEPQVLEPQLVEPELVGPEPMGPQLVEPELAEPLGPQLVEPELVEPELVGPESVEPQPVEPQLVEPELVEPARFDFVPAVNEPGPRRATGLVAFASTPSGYRLVQLEGPAPAVGDVVDLPELGELVTLRLGPSPLPDDARTCVYLERLVRSEAAAPA